MTNYPRPRPKRIRQVRTQRERLHEPSLRVPGGGDRAPDVPVAYFVPGAGIERQKPDVLWRGCGESQPAGTDRPVDVDATKSNSPL